MGFGDAFEKVDGIDTTQQKRAAFPEQRRKENKWPAVPQQRGEICQVFL